MRTRWEKIARYRGRMVISYANFMLPVRIAVRQLAVTGFAPDLTRYENKHTTQSKRGP